MLYQFVTQHLQPQQGAAMGHCNWVTSWPVPRSDHLRCPCAPSMPRAELGTIPRKELAMAMAMMTKYTEHMHIVWLWQNEHDDDRADADADADDDDDDGDDVDGFGYRYHFGDHHSHHDSMRVINH